MLAREPAPLGEALGEALRRDGIELYLGVHATAARREGEDYVLSLEDGRELRGDRLLVATGRRPRVPDGLETVGVQAGPHGIPVDAHLRAGERLWAVGDVTGVRLLTHVGKYQGEVVASNILGEPREANYEAIPDVVYTDPQAAAVGAIEDRFSGTAPLSEVAKTATYTHAYAESNGFLTLLSDGERLTGAYALGPEAGEWLQQATLAIRARVPLDVLRDVIQPFPTFSEIYVDALKALRRQIAAAQQHDWNVTMNQTGQKVAIITGGSQGIGAGRSRPFASEAGGWSLPPAAMKRPRTRTCSPSMATSPSLPPPIGSRRSAAKVRTDRHAGEQRGRLRLQAVHRLHRRRLRRGGRRQPGGFFWLTQRAIAEMLKRHGGHVVNIWRPRGGRELQSALGPDRADQGRPGLGHPVAGHRVRLPRHPGQRRLAGHHPDADAPGGKLRRPR